MKKKKMTIDNCLLIPIEAMLTAIGTYKYDILKLVTLEQLACIMRNSMRCHTAFRELDNTLLHNSQF